MELEDDDEIYMYGDMEFNASSVVTVDPSKIKYGKDIASGRFANIKLANIKEKNGGFSEVAAKMIKGRSLQFLHMQISWRESRNYII